MAVRLTKKQMELLQFMRGEIPQPPQYAPGGLAVAMARLRRKMRKPMRTVLEFEGERLELKEARQ